MGLGLYTRSIADDKGVNVTNIKRLLAGILCVLFAFGTVPVTAYANKDDGLHRTVVVGYFEKSNFQEGMDDDSMKSGYGYEYIQKIAGYTGWKYEYVYGTFQELIEMLMDGSIDMLAGVSYSDERAERINYAKYSMASAKADGKPYYLCTAKARTDLQNDIDKALDDIHDDDPVFVEELRRKYYNYSNAANELSDDESSWLKKHNTLKVGYINNYLPYSDTDSNGNVTGVVKDVVDNILDSLKLGDKLTVTYHGYDSYYDMMSDVRKENIDVMFPYGGDIWYSEQNGIVQSTSVIDAGMTLAYKGEYTSDTTSKIAVNKNNLLQQYYVEAHYPDADLVVCDSLEECFDAVLDGRAGCSIFTALRSSNVLRNAKYDTIISMQLPISDVRCFGIATGNVSLLRLINHGIDCMDSQYALSKAYDYVEGMYKYSFREFMRDNVVGVVIAFIIIIVLVIVYSVKRSEDLRKQVAEDKRRSRELSEALNAAQHASRAKTTFLNNMSHDIRTPMNAIIGFTSLAVTHIDNKQQVKDYLSKIMTSSNHLLSLINDILDMSRIESGQVKIEENECNFPTIMHDLRNILQSDVRAKRLDFFIDTVDVVDEDIICDKLRLNQILLNCTGNAIKFTKPGGTVGIRIVQKPGAPEGYANFDFIIKDTGIGMSENFVEHMFEPFTREESSTVSGIPGTGLGMSITKNIIDMMGGSIDVKSEKNVGTEITISLSFKLGTTHQRVSVIKDLVGLRALVADDSMDTCVSVSRMLESIGMSAEWTMSGVEATYKAKYAYEDGKPYKAFIIDWLMPDMNGVEVVRRIRAEIGNDTPIIILTAYDWSDIEEEARAAGVTAFCAKPIFLSDLYGILSEKVDNDDENVTDITDIDFGGKRVLLVEDNELNMEIAVEIIGRTGASIETAVNGQVAVDMFAKSPEGYYDLIFMDIQMPVMDGYEASRIIRGMDRSDAAGVPIVAMTANAFTEDKQTAYEAGMNEHTPKPIEVKELYKIMKKYLK